MNDSEPSPAIRCGIAALVGPPNVGKSTLLNALLGQKISIVSPKPQTTRNRIVGIDNGPDYQIVLLDTPGIHKARSAFNREMVRTARESLAEVDAVVFMVDASSPSAASPGESLRCLQGVKTPVLLLINKIDLLSREKLLPLIARLSELHPFTAVIPISALNSDGIERVREELLNLLPVGPRLYPEDMPTESTERFIVAEIIREKVFLLTREEIPYATAVVVDRFEESGERGLVTIHATIVVEKDSQKGVLIGRQGGMLQKIGSAARHDIEALLGERVLLKLWVKVQKDWTSNPRFLQELGFHG